MTETDAARVLADQELVPVLHGAMAYIKELVSKCLGAEIPAMAFCPPKSGTS